MTNDSVSSSNGTVADDVDIGPEAQAAYHWYLLAVNAILIGPTVIGNSLIILALVRFRRLRAIKSYILIGNLAVSDLCVGVLTMPMEIAFQLSENLAKSITFCTIHYCFIYMFIGLSVVNLFLLSLERFDAILSPFIHDRRFTRRRIYVTIAITWVVMVVFGFTPLFLIEEIDSEHFQCRMSDVFPWVYRKVFNCILLLCLLLSTAFYVYVVKVATKSLEGLKHSDNVVRQRQMKKDLRHTRNMLLITGLFIVFWTPFCVVSIVPNPSQTLLFVRNWFASLGAINSSINWIVYGARCKKFRAAFLSILNCKCIKKEYNLPPSLS